MLLAVNLHGVFVNFGYKCFVQSPVRHSRCTIWRIYIERYLQIKMAEEEIPWPTHPPKFIMIDRLLQNVFCFGCVNCFCVVSVLLCLGGSSGSVSEGRVLMLHWLSPFHSTSSCRLDMDLGLHVCTSFVPQGFPVDWIQIWACLSLPIYILQSLRSSDANILTFSNLELRQ